MSVLQEKTGYGAPGSPPGSSAQLLGYLGVTCDGLAHLDRAGHTLRNDCFVTARRREEPVKVTIWLKLLALQMAMSSSLFPFSQSHNPSVALSATPAPNARCRYSSSELAVPQTHLHFSLCVIMVCLPLSLPRACTCLHSGNIPEHCLA